MARPKKEIDFDILERYCNILCTHEEIAYLMGLDIDTIQARVNENYNISFSEYYKRHSTTGKMSLRRKQFEVAVKKGNVAMLIWLGKQYLNQKDQTVLASDDESPFFMAYALPPKKEDEQTDS